MSNKTLESLKQSRPWIAYIDDERDIDHSIIVTLADNWFFADERDCGVRGCDTVREVKQATAKSNVIYRG